MDRETETERQGQRQRQRETETETVKKTHECTQTCRKRPGSLTVGFKNDVAQSQTLTPLYLHPD